MDEKESEELACAWSDYRSAFGPTNPLVAYKTFKAGWEAARGAEQNGVLR